jgi:soluble lytic murein transglycosylase
MENVSKRVFFPVFLVVFAGTLLGLLVASPGPRPSREEPPDPQPASPLPWEPLSRPPDGIREVRAAASKLPRERLEALEAIYQDGARPQTARGLAAFAAGVYLSENGRGPEAIERFRSPAIAATELSGYALFLAARELEARQPDAALQALAELDARHPDFVYLDGVRLAAARLLIARGRREEAIPKLRQAAEGRDETVRGEALDELAAALSDEKQYADAIVALETLYYVLPRHPRAPGAGKRLSLLRQRVSDSDPTRLHALGMRRAELLMQEGRHREACETLTALVSRPPRLAASQVERARLELGVCQYARRQFVAALSTLKKVSQEDLLPRALYYRAESSRRLRQTSGYLETSSELLLRYPKSPWSEEMLFALARYYGDREEPVAALSQYRRLADGFPGGKYSLEARWRLLWDDYRKGKLPEAAFGWEEAAREHPGDDAVSKFLYWAGRAWQGAGRFDRAEPLYRQVLLGYQNTYYGRRAFEHLSEIDGQQASLARIEAARSGIDLSDSLRVERVSLQTRIAQLHAVGLLKDALFEAELAVTGSRDDAAFLAIAAWIYSSRERNLDAFRILREAFPFHVSATGDLLPRPIWELFYPLHYWEHVSRYSQERELDPYLVAALIRQESTFNPRVRSRAGARGLMQILPSTGRVLARQEKRRYNASELYDPEVNIRYGTRYLKEVLGSFSGRVDYALASYNAGPHRVRRWTEMDLTIPSEIFIEEIPFDETRDYVRFVLRNEMLYRRLYQPPRSAAAE